MTTADSSAEETRQQPEKQVPEWSDIPRDIVERVIGYLNWTDRIRIRAVCKAWSTPNHHVPGISKVPWALKINYGEYRLLDPFSGEYIIKDSSIWKEYLVKHFARPCASAYGWILLRKSLFYLQTERLFLYSPFTTEVIKLPDIGVPLPVLPMHQVYAFSLNATSPKCVIFLLHLRRYKINIKLCSAGDHSWKSFEFNCGFDNPCGECAVNAVYAKGVFYCVFTGGQLGAFDVELEEWSILADHPLPGFPTISANLIASGADLWLLNRHVFQSFKLFKFDFSEMRWVYENNLNNRVLFIGTTSFSVAAVGVETSELADTIFCLDGPSYSVRRYGSTYRTSRESQLYRKCSEATEFGMVWIEIPSGGIWRANDLINAA
ncbi:hypothetical protein HRI_003924400 [Hibiscus trionum]|uniref:F-box domain-containing protein n=1 Tax=Hibiscus trionum TaxID=183268 RepID=A0A9W7IWU2_HIBTR|nr:hypothetical protein HRI_003924400 [Hibiscus trionum]